ncbi:SpoIIE family protein phosphatase [Streptomyces sp. NPDC005773]|uniref:SpoIIE family protein phosphatase n=1 Tax=Streptomyces sp. NPDC005773 TaxID=3364727 RepID=UPI0036959C02
MLRPLPSHWAGLDQAASYTAADVAARVGGDFYDIQPSPHGTRLVLGDVQGKVLGAVSTASVLAGSFREAASDGVTEARDSSGAFFPLLEHLDTALRTDPELAEPRHLVHDIRNAASRHTARGLTDDTTILAVRRTHH